MLAKLTAENQLTLPKAIVAQIGAADYFEVEASEGRIVLTPVRTRQGDAVREKLAALDITDQDIADAVAHARGQPR